MLSEAVEKSVAALGDIGAVAAEVAAVRLLAAAVEGAPDDTDLWREFRMALKALREVTGDSDVDESIQDLIGRLGRTDVRNAQDAREG